MTDYRNLIVWKKSVDLAELIYRLVRFLPKEELFVLSDQMRRSALSVPSNIAEGQGRDTNAEFIRFLRIANGSRAELETQLYLCGKLYKLPDEQLILARQLTEEVGKMLYAMIDKLSSKPAS